MPSPAPDEVIYEPPARTPAWWGAAVGAVVLVVLLGALIAKLLQNRWAAAGSVVALVLWFVAQSLRERDTLLRPKRVIAVRSRRELVVEHRRGTVAIPFDDVASIEPGVVLVGDGLTLDAVTVHRKSGGSVCFGVLDKGRGEGAARAIRAILDPAADGAIQE